MAVAVYPGSFDPITNGHLDVLKRSLKVFDKVIVLVASNHDKKYKFSVDERIEMIKDATKDLKNVVVDSTDGITVKYAKSVGATCLIRGLRAVTDFEYEFKLSAANEYIDPTIDEVFFMSHADTCLAKVVAWYDNEMGYTHQMISTLRYLLSLEK